MTVIALTQEMGSLAKDVAEQVGRDLGLKVMRHEVVDNVSSRMRVPFSIIAPVIVVVCAIGAYSVHSAMLDIWFMMLFGVVGYAFKKLDYPLAPLVLALVLGDKAEDSFRQSMLVSQGDVMIMWSNPLVGSITTLALVLLFWPLISRLLAKVRRPKKVDPVLAEQPVD